MTIGSKTMARARATIKAGLLAAAQLDGLVLRQFQLDAVIVDAADIVINARTDLAGVEFIAQLIFIAIAGHGAIAVVGDPAAGIETPLALKIHIALAAFNCGTFAAGILVRPFPGDRIGLSHGESGNDRQ